MLSNLIIFRMHNTSTQSFLTLTAGLRAIKKAAAATYFMFFMMLKTIGLNIRQ